MTPLVWLGIVLCIVQSAIFSGLNLAVFTVSKLRLEVEAAAGNRDARRVLALRQKSNLLLTTILWGNVGINVLLAQLAGSVLVGVSAFLFSTVLITLVGEILPQAYFSRNALRVASFLAPLLRVYRAVLFPLAKPTAVVLDRLLGSEKTAYLTEHAVRELITLHAKASEADVDHVEGIGALNFLEIDDVPVAEEGEPVDPDSIVKLAFRSGVPRFPRVRRSCDDEFLRVINRSGKKWVVIVDELRAPRFVLDADGFLREALLGGDPLKPLRHCHRPIVVTHPGSRLGDVLPRLNVHPTHPEDNVIDEDIILLWGEKKRIITGSDILGRLLRGIARTVDSLSEQSMPQRNPL